MPLSYYGLPVMITCYFGAVTSVAPDKVFFGVFFIQKVLIFFLFFCKNASLEMHSSR